MIVQIILIIFLIILSLGLIRILSKPSNGNFLEILGDLFFVDVFVDIISSTIDSIFD